MADPLRCLRGSTIAIAAWNILYSLIQFGIMGWQVKYVRDRQWEFENRELPANGYVDGFQARFPGLYAIYSESPERRRINALFALAITTLVVCFAHLCLSVLLLYGSITRRSHCVWPWFFSAIPVVALSTAYAVLWWSGDIFGEQLAMSVAEFVMSLAVNGICIVVVAFFFLRLRGQLTSVRPKLDGDSEDDFRFKGSKESVAWRRKWSDRPPKNLAKKLRRKERKERERRARSLSRQRRDSAYSRFSDLRRSGRLLRSPRASREALIRGSDRRRAQSEPRVSRMPQKSLPRNDPSPCRAMLAAPAALTHKSLQAHDEAIEKVRRDNLARHPDGHLQRASAM